MIDASFPADWPGCCPPDDAMDAEGTVFRLAKRNPLQTSDVTTHLERGAAPNADPCLRAGLSVMRTKEDALHMARLFRRMWKFVARGTLDPTHGKLKLTERKVPSHATWWPYDGVDRLAPFTEVEALP